MNGFQGVASVIYVFGILGSLLFFNDENTILIGIAGIISSTVLFFLMYALGEIIKQLRISNEIFYDNEEK